MGREMLKKYKEAVQSSPRRGDKLMDKLGTGRNLKLTHSSGKALTPAYPQLAPTLSTALGIYNNNFLRAF
jgi:hypothetical protein